MTARIAPRPLPAREASRKAEAWDRSRAVGHQDRVHAPFVLRCGAFLIDYVLLAATVALSTILGRLIEGRAQTAGGTAELFGAFAAVVVAAVNFGLLTTFTGRSIGKWTTGLRIERTNGMSVGWVRSFVRHFLGYPLSFLTFGLGFLMAAFNAQGRALHDIVAGTVVTRDVASPQRTTRQRPKG